MIQNIRELNGISIIIPTTNRLLKKSLLKQFTDCPINYEIIIANSKGLGFARNEGAMKAKYDLLMFVDDDIVIDSDSWKFLLELKKGECKMPFSAKNYPCSRIMVIHKKTFSNGFDNAIRYVGEDLDFYLRKRNSVKFIRIPDYVYLHLNHVRKRRKFHLERGYLLLKHGWNYLRGDVIFTNYARRPIKALLMILGFYYHLFKNRGFMD